MTSLIEALGKSYMMMQKGSRMLTVKMWDHEYERVKQLAKSIGARPTSLIRAAILLALECRVDLDLAASFATSRLAPLVSVSIVVPVQLYEMMRDYCDNWRRCSVSMLVRAVVRELISGRLKCEKKEEERKEEEKKESEEEEEVEFIIPHLRGGRLEKKK